MDLENFIASLNGRYKESVIALMCCFPLAYIDCWRVWDRFESLELFPQILFSAGIAVLMVGAGMAGVAANEDIMVRDNKNSVDTLAINALYPAGLTTLSVLLFDIRGKWMFLVAFVGWWIFYWSLVRFFNHSAKN